MCLARQKYYPLDKLIVEQRHFSMDFVKRKSVLLIGIIWKAIQFVAVWNPLRSSFTPRSQTLKLVFCVCGDWIDVNFGTLCKRGQFVCGLPIFSYLINFGVGLSFFTWSSDRRVVLQMVTLRHLGTQRETFKWDASFLHTTEQSYARGLTHTLSCYEFFTKTILSFWIWFMQSYQITQWSFCTYHFVLWHRCPPTSMTLKL